MMQRYRSMVDAAVQRWCDALPAQGLYEPMAYLMGLPAKRVRPVATLMACELFGGNAEQALEEAIGIELFHNFTLMHDDIMDASPLRRGDPTVHVKWNVNTAILSGDAMLVKAYELMGTSAEVFQLFNRYALLVCEGQQLDMDFERRDDVTASEYMEMIRLKTAVLLACAMEIGASKAGASPGDRERIGRFGERLGLAFQLRDDVLDAFGDPMLTGKQRGGDLRAGKKTWLLLRGLELAGSDLRSQLSAAPADRDVAAMVRTLEEAGVRQEAESLIASMESEALEALDALQVDEARKLPLRDLASTLMARKH